jgi:hypothetical protein
MESYGVAYLASTVGKMVLSSAAARQISCTDMNMSLIKALHRT